MKYIILLVLSLAMFYGCSGMKEPLTPHDQNFQDDSIPIIAFNQSDNQFNAVGLLGAYEMVLSGDLSSADLIPIRTSSIGESYIVNGISYFTITPCSDCLKIKSIALSADNLIEVTFSIRHPFLPGDTLKPPSAINRLDLDIFDVALLVRPLDITPDPYPLTGTPAYTGILAGNAGYTSELANVIDDDAALPYVLVVDDNDAGTDSYNEFPMGAESEFKALFAITENTDFGLYLTFGYGASAKKPQRLSPTYYNPEFNRKSAWKVAVTPPNGSNPPAMGNTWNDSDTSTLFDVTVAVYDWQIGANVDPLLTNPTDISAASGVSSVSLEIPGMHGSLIQTSTADSGSGTPSDPLIYTLSVANENDLDAGTYWGLVKVTDERSPGTVNLGGETDTLVDCPNGVTLNWVNMPEFATYQVFPATVVIGCGPITGQIDSPSQCPSDLSNGVTVDFTVSASSSNGGEPIVLYEVDFDYNGTSFSADASNLDGIFNDVGPFTVPPPCDDNVPYSFTVAFRATDSCTPPNLTIFTTCEVTVLQCCGPVQDVWVNAINRGESGADAELITSVDLDWDDNACAVQYAIERGRGYEGDQWTVVGTSTSSSYKYILSGTDWDEDYRYRVIARQEMGGNPLTDFAPSEEVFILFMSDGGYTSGNRWKYGYWEDWDFQCADWQGGCTVDSWPNNPSYGNYAVGICALLTALPDVWSVERNPYPIPDLDGQSEAFWDGYWWSANYGWTATSAFTIGTLSNPEPPLTTTNCDFEPATEIYNSLPGFNILDVEGLNNEFCETGVDGWTGSDGTFQNWKHIGAYMNELLDADRDYIALGFANGSIVNTYYIVGWCDAMAFVVQ
jgi:hypothetical protein